MRALAETKSGKPVHTTRVLRTFGIQIVLQFKRLAQIVCCLVVLSGLGPALLVSPARASSVPPLQLVGFMPDVGSANDVTVDPAAGLAYTSSPEFGLSIVDLGNPAQPTVLSAVNPPFYSEHVAADGNLAVAVAGATGGLRVVDVTNPTVPQLLAYIGGTFRGVAVAGTHAYAIETVPGNPATQNLDVVDLSNPQLPVVVGRAQVGGGFSPPVRIVGALAYVAWGGFGFAIVDVSNPVQPRVLATVATSKAVTGITVVNGYAYVADSTALWVVDVHTPSEPRIVNSLTDSATAVTAASASMLYVITGFGSALQIVDITFPLRPVVLGTTGCYGAQAVAALGNEVLLANATGSGVYVIDATSPSAPTLVTHLYNGFSNLGVATSGSLAVATGQGAGMRVVDVSNPLAPSIVGKMGGDLRKVAMAGTYAFVANVISGNPASTVFLAVDVSTPSQPTVRSRITFGGNSIQDIKVVGSLAYLATVNGLQIMDISTPASPATIGSLTTSSSAKAVAIDGRYAYVGTSSGILVVDVSAPSRPSQVGIYTAVAPSALAAANGMLYALQGGIAYLIGVSVPSAPVLLGSINGSGAAGLDVVGQLLLLARPVVGHNSSMAELLVVDVSTPAQPQIVQQVALPGTTSSVVVADGLVYVGDSATTVDVLAFSPARTPTSTPAAARTFTPTRTPTPAPSRTRTSTPVPTASASIGVAGQLHYYSNPSLMVNGATIQLQSIGTGTVAAVTQTNSTGRFTFSGIGVGNWEVEPQKNGDFGSAVDISDAVTILQSSVGAISLTPGQRIACDVNGDGSVDIIDAILILQYAIGLTPRFPVAQQCGSDWAFVPDPAPATNQQVLPPQIASGVCRNGAIAFSPLATSANNQNFSAVLFGDCTGNWPAL